VLLYALGVGAGAEDPTGPELAYTTENSDGITLAVLPTFAVLPGGSDTSRFASMPGRFSRPVFPGERLTIKMWHTSDSTATFQTEKPSGAPVLTNGHFTLAP